MILNTDLNLTLRPMQYPQFFKLYKDSIKNIWTTDELDFSIDYEHLRDKLNPKESHLIKRLVAFFATADNLVAHNLVLNFYKHLNSPEYRMFLGKQLFDEMLHVETYLLLVDNYLPDPVERAEAFDAYRSIPSVKLKADFCFKYMDSIHQLDKLDTDEKRRQFLQNLICFAACVEGLFFFGSFAYVYFLRSKGLLPGLAAATNWVFRDETTHIEAAMAAIQVIREEYPHLFDENLKKLTEEMIEEAIDVEMQFCGDALSLGVSGMSPQMMKDYLMYCADNRLVQLGYPKKYLTKNPFPFMVLQDVQSLTNFFEKRVTEYQKGFSATKQAIVFDESF
ncbi:MAG: ribonucleoside-diphosphate reductase [Proteobacteria bacterium]|nr:ribonucleoside-diphosphate reductase [Pseudomonadota bacterium]NDC24805.1 ribonucleoside-diphosphate reductase [Pseudomonadota bacterium]NDD04380.1 ribonucleoside-diphosphate reductase [Pseudomonadota bacterium]NDG26893.1 ribonucleoside-diphosphate reductase [Pseudomonadota bacterium]